MELFVNGNEIEEGESTICRKWVQAGDSCLDIGANVGSFAAMFAQAVGESGKVVAVEPVESTRNDLKQLLSVLELPNVLVEGVCVSDQIGATTFMVAIDQQLNTTAAMRVDPGNAGSFREERVLTSTLDALVKTHGLRESLSVVKIDIEGAEPLALKGASSLFDPERLPLFLVEIHKAALGNFGHSPGDVWSFFHPEQFELYHVQRSVADLTPKFKFGQLYSLDDAAAHQWPWYSNLLAIPRKGRYAARRDRIASELPARVSV